MYRKLESLSGCILCGEDKPLLKSHVVPKFFRKWLAKELGEAPRFQNPYTRVGRYHDDLSKHQLCCFECEAVMARDESTARTQMLVNWKREESPVSAYGSWLARFAAGLAAKAAAVQLYSPPSIKTEADLNLPFNRMADTSLPADEREWLAEALETWRHFVLGKLPNPARHELHLLGVNMEALPGLKCVFGHHHVRTDSCSGILILLSGVAVLGVVRAASDLTRRSTRIAIREGVVGARNYELTPMIAEALKKMSDANVRTWEVERRLLEEKL
jgi:hypothetical protein